MNSDCLETGVDPGPTPVSLILPCLNEVNYIEDASGRFWEVFNHLN